MIRWIKLLLVGDVRINLVKPVSYINMHILFTLLHIFL